MVLLEEDTCCPGRDKECRQAAGSVPGGVGPVEVRPLWASGEAFWESQDTSQWGLQRGLGPVSRLSWWLG